jgi:hypothetical protein
VRHRGPIHAHAAALIATPGCVLLLCLLLAGCGGSSRAATTKQPSTELHTLPGIVPPLLTVTHAAQGVAPGYVFVAQKGAPGDRRGGLVIADNRGRIRWFHQLDKPIEATDFRTQVYRGKPVLTWWEGRISKAGVGRGLDVVYDTSYRKIATVKAGHGLSADLHEFELTPRGTAFITIYHEVPADLSSVGGPKKGWAYDSVVQEIDVASGRVVFEWHSIGHVPLSESLEANREPAKHATKKRPLDYFHVNSVSGAPGGRILISARNTSTIYELNRDGSIVWRLGGKHSDFGPPAAVRFFYQHNARLHPGGLLSLFDNGATPKAEPYTRPMVLRLDVPKRRAAVVQVYAHPQELLSPFEGNLQLLPGGAAFVGWGGVRRVTEFSRSGNVRFELKLPFGDSYRGFRAVWTGRAPGRPVAAVDGDTVYASWNGSTNVARWAVLAGPDAAHLTRVAGAAWNGLETAIPVKTSEQSVAVRAFDQAGHALATSALVDR